MMPVLRNRPLFLTAILLLVFALSALPAAAGDIVLSNNSGNENAVFFVEGEASLVINGFDLTPLSMHLPTALDAVTISVSAPVPGGGAELVVYEDPNGGSPVDAVLVHRQQVALGQSGPNRVALSQPVIITEPVIWVGFYLPVGFRFNADQSGSSVLTYWAWTPGGAFDLNSLGSAAVLGPGDGSAPVGIQMDGIARISAELRTPQYDEMEATLPLDQQIVANIQQDTSVLEIYDGCGTLLYDPADTNTSLANTFSLSCRVAYEVEAPTVVANPQNQLLDMQRAGHLYKISTLLSEDQLEPGATSQLPVRTTHCMRIQPGDLEVAVIGETRESQQWGERWHILPSVRFGDIVCAEVSVANYLSYFLPRTPESPPNVNLTLGWTRVHPHPLVCGLPARLQVPLINTGQSWFETPTGHVKLTVQDFHVKSGIPTMTYIMQINTETLGPGNHHLVEMGPVRVALFFDELHRLEVRVDDDNVIAETNEDDNIWFTEYILSTYRDSLKCPTAEELAKIEEKASTRHWSGREYERWLGAWSDLQCREPQQDGDITCSFPKYDTENGALNLCRETHHICSISPDPNNSDNLLVYVKKP